MISSSPGSHHATPVKHYDRAITLVFGSDGQVSLIGFDDGITSQIPGVSQAFTPGTTGTQMPGIPSLSSELASTISAPNLEATTSSLSRTQSFAPTSTSASVASSVVSSNSSISSTATSTDTNLPSVPTINHPTPSPTPAANPADHGVGAPFYLAVVLASVSFVGCVSAFIAWWIRSRARKNDVELNDPWNPADAESGSGSHSADELEKEGHMHLETQTRPYYLPASIVRRSSSDLLVPHTNPPVGEGPQNSSSRLDPHQSLPSSQMNNPYARPGAERLPTGLSVQESTRTLGRLRVANRVPGDITSGDEGGMIIPRLQDGVGLPSSTNTGVPTTAMVEENMVQPDRGDRSAQEGDSPVDPPGPATLSWGRRIDTVAALRRTRRRTPGTTVKTYKNPKYGGYWYPKPDGEPSGMMDQGPAVTNQEDRDKALARPPLDPLDWTSTLKSSFWQAVDAMTGNRSSDPESRPENVGSSSRFTPAPLRVASRRSPISPTSSSSPPDARTARSNEAEADYDRILQEKSFGTLRNANHPGSSSALTRTNELDVPRINEGVTRGVDPVIQKVSRLNHDLGASTTYRYPYSLKTETGSVYSTDSAAARGNLRKYGYGDPIPSSWSALGETRESQLNLERLFLPLPRPISTPSPGPLPITPSQLTLESDARSASVSMRTRTSMHSRNDLIGSDAGTVRSGKETHLTGSTYSMSRNGTIQSGRSTIGHRTAPLQPVSGATPSSMLNRKKGVTTRRKRPRAPQRAPSSASSVQSIESELSIREAAVRRALLERRRKVREMGSLKDREDNLIRSRDESSS